MEYKNTDYKMVSSGNARVGYCSKCGGKNFYDVEKIAKMKSRGCNTTLVPEGERGKWCR